MKIDSYTHYNSRKEATQAVISIASNVAGHRRTSLKTLGKSVLYWPRNLKSNFQAKIKRTKENILTLNMLNQFAAAVLLPKQDVPVEIWQ